MNPCQEADRVLAELRHRVQASELSQRQLEKKAGFSQGYLSQLFAHNMELKYRHVMAVLEALGVDPRDFFSELYPPSGHPALEAFRRSSQPISDEMEQVVSQLYGSGADSLQELQGRVERCERAVRQLEEMGLLEGRRRLGESGG